MLWGCIYIKANSKDGASSSSSRSKYRNKNRRGHPSDVRGARFTLGGVKLYVDFYFFALLAVFILLQPDGGAVSGFIAAAVHECGHLAAILCANDVKLNRLSVGVFGLKISSNGAEDSRHWAIICAGGVLANFCSFIIMLPFAMLLDDLFLTTLSGAQLCLGCISLLPVEPLDGGRLLRALLTTRLSPEVTERLLLAAAAIVLLPLLTAGLYLLMQTSYNFSLLLLGLWLLAGIIKEYI